jgi:two-component system sensor histidine kinase CpxA
MAERLETAASLQRRLLRDVSHELRSPLARLQVGIGILRQVSTDQKTQATVERLDDEAGRLSRMIQDLLMISRLESREWTLSRERVDVSALVSELAADAAFEARTRGSTVQVGRLDPMIMEGSPSLLRSAIDNVVRNAVRHTAEGTTVEIDVRAHPESDPPGATVTVRDHGAGLPDDQLTRIFEPFYRVDDARAESAGGAGLGLAIARRAVEEHGGSIEARRAEGGGLAVLIRLPLDRP